MSTKRIALRGAIAALLVASCDSGSPAAGSGSTGANAPATSSPVSSGAASASTGGASENSSSSSDEGSGEQGEGSTSGRGSSTGETGSSTGSVPPDRPPSQALATVEWATAVTASWAPIRLAVWNDVPTAVVPSLRGDNLVVGVDHPSEVTVPTNELPVPVLVSFDESSGAVASARPLVLLETPDFIAQVAGADAQDVFVSETGELYVAGSWLGNATFFPDTPYAASMQTIAEGEWLEELEYEEFTGAHDPFVFRLAPDESVDWIVRGETLGPLSPNIYRNRAENVTIGPNGDLFVSGSTRVPGMSFPSGGAGAFVSQGSETFVARLEASTGQLLGTTYGSSPQTMTSSTALDNRGGMVSLSLLGAGTGVPMTYVDGTPGGAVVRNDHLVRVGAAGEFERAMELGAGAHDLEILESGAAIAFGDVQDGIVIFVDADGVEHFVVLAEADPDPQWVAHIGPLDSIPALEPIPDPVRIQMPRFHATAAAADAEGVWWAANIHDLAWFDDGEDIPGLAALELGPDDLVTALVHVGLDGTIDRTRVLGKNLDLQDLVWLDEAQGQLLISLGARCAPYPPGALLAPAADRLDLLAAGCTTDADWPALSFVASITLDPS